ncbi:MAG TPA: FtsX-like permease family protein [Polyangiales bacterium]|nr:FtsX-like permease family protein [Polyangiales bacterium]
MAATRGRLLLTMLGIVLGVGVVFAVSVVNVSVLEAMRQSFASITGKARLHVGAGVGVDEDRLERVRSVPGVAAAIPVIEISLRDVRTNVQLAVIAVDTLSDPSARGYDVVAQDAHIDDIVAFLNDPYGVLITPGYAKRTGVKVGDRLLLDTSAGRREFSVHGTLEPRGMATVYGGDLLLMDVYAAQIAFERGRRFDRIDVIPAAGIEVDALAGALNSALDHQVPISRPEHRAAESERVLAGYRLSLSLASVVALFVGAFIIFNSLAIAVAQRRREVGILRALGTTRAQVLSLFVGEGLLIGILGSALGLAFGLGLAHAALGAVSAAISSLYMPIKVGTLTVTATEVLRAFGLGVCSATFAAFVPARRAATIDPVEALTDTIQSADVAVPSTRFALGAAAAVLALALGIGCLAHTYVNVSAAILAACLLLLGGVCCVPVIAELVGRLVHRHAKHVGPAALLGTVAFTRNRGRNAVSIAALGLGLANLVATDTLIGSMQSATQVWLDRSFRANIFVFAGSEVHAKFEHPLPAALHDELRSVPGVEFVQAFRMAPGSFRGEPYYLMSEDFQGYRKYNELPVVAGDLAQALPQIEAGEALAASELFVRHFHIGLDDTLTLDTPDGPRSFRIALVYTDYRADIGVLLTTRAVYRRVFRDDLVDLYSVYVTQPDSVARVRGQIAERFCARYGVLALGGGDYKQELVNLIERSMKLPRATQLIAVLVAGLGIINALLVGVLDRRREIGVLKALGADRKQVGRIVLTEAVLIACTSAFVGVLLGTALSAYMVFETVGIEVGWNIPLHLSGWVFAETFLLAVPVALFAAWWPTRWASRLEVVEALQYE